MTRVNVPRGHVAQRSFAGGAEADITGRLAHHAARLAEILALTG